MNRDAGDLREFFLHAVFEGSGDVVDLGWVAQRLFAVWFCRPIQALVQLGIAKTTQARAPVLLGTLYLAGKNFVVYNCA